MRPHHHRSRDRQGARAKCRMTKMPLDKGIAESLLRSSCRVTPGQGRPISNAHKNKK